MHQEKLKEGLENFVLCPAEIKNIQKYRPDLEKGRVILLPSNEHIQHLKKNTLKRDLFCSATGNILLCYKDVSNADTAGAAPPTQPRQAKETPRWARDLFCTSINSDWSLWLCPILFPFLAWIEGRSSYFWPWGHKGHNAATGTTDTWKNDLLQPLWASIKSKEFSSHARESLHLHSAQRTFSWKTQ